MSYRRKWTPSKTKIKEFVNKMNEIENFCAEKGISSSKSNDSYYFYLNGKHYRVSNHSIERSNAKSYNWMGEKVREQYHLSKRDENTFYIHASKTRIIEIYTNLEKGYVLDGHGNVISKNED